MPTACPPPGAPVPTIGPPPRLARAVASTYAATSLALALLTGVALSGFLVLRRERWGTHVLARLQGWWPTATSDLVRVATASAVMLAAAATLAFALSRASLRLRSRGPRPATPIVLVPLLVHALGCLAGSLALVASPFVRRTSPWNGALDLGLAAAMFALVIGGLPCVIGMAILSRGGALVTVLLAIATIAFLTIATLSATFRT